MLWCIKLVYQGTKCCSVGESCRLPWQFCACKIWRCSVRGPVDLGIERLQVQLNHELMRSWAPSLRWGLQEQAVNSTRLEQDFFFSPLIFANQSSPRLPNPKGRPGMSDVPSCLESQGCYIWFPFPNSLVFFCLVLLFFLSCHFSANGPFSWLLQKTLKYFSLRFRLFFVWLLLSS